MVLKECIVCGNEFDGYNSSKVCSDECRKERQREHCRKWRKNNKDKAREYDRKWRENNKDKIRVKKQEYREQNKDKINERNRKYREQNKDKINEKRREYYKNNKDKFRERRKKNREYVREYYQNNKDKFREHKIKYYKKLLESNPELTSENRWQWGYVLKLDESKSSKYTYNGTHHAHHIFPVILYPELGLEEWNGVVLPDDWHYEFHATHNLSCSKDWLCDWSGELFDFIEMKIHESNQDLVLLDQWIPMEGK